MGINVLQAHPVDLANVPLENLAANKQASEKDKVAEASRAFEALLLRQILQESQKPVFPSKVIGSSTVDGIYKDMVINQLAESISKSGSFGLAQGLAAQLQDQTHSKQPAPAAPSATPARRLPHYLKSPKHE